MAEAMSGVKPWRYRHGDGDGDGRVVVKGARRREWFGVCNIPNRRWSNCSITTSDGGQMVVELVGAFNQLTQNMSSCESVVFEALKLSIPLLRSLPPLPGGRSALSAALSVALLLADLRMDADVISAALLRRSNISLSLLRSRLGSGTAHLLHDSLRLSNALSAHSSDDLLDSDAAAADLRRFCLTFYDARAVAIEVALAVDAVTHDLRHLPRSRQHLLALRALKIHAPLAHALGLGLGLSHRLEDLSFRCLFPYSYLYLDAWLRRHSGGASLLPSYRDTLRRALEADASLSGMVSGVSVAGRYKSRYSTMKKLLKDGRSPEEVNDVLGLRVVLDSPSVRSCYRARDVVRSLWPEVPHRTKDYISKPKPNGYRSLHMAVDVSEPDRTRPLMEIQIRTAEMDSAAAAGDASHSFYKAGLTDPQQAKRLKAMMVAALRLKDIDVASTEAAGDRVFGLLDKNGDGMISMEELMEVMEELGAPGEDARQVMKLLDSNSDGSLSSEEFRDFQRRLEFIRRTDQHYTAVLSEKLCLAQDTVRECDQTN